MPDAPVTLRLSMDQLLDLDVRLHGHQRPESGFGSALGLAVIGAVGMAGGVVLMIGAVSSGIQRISSAISGGASGSGPNAGQGLVIAAGVVFGVGVLTLVTGLVLSFTHRAQSRPWDQRDRLRRFVGALVGFGEGGSSLGLEF